MGILEEVQNALSYYQKTAVDEKDTLYLHNIYSQLYYILSVENRPLSSDEFDSLKNTDFLSSKTNAKVSAKVSLLLCC